MSSEARFNSQWGSSLIPRVTFQVGGPEADILLVALIHGSGVKSRNATVLPRPLHLHEYPPMTLYPRVQREPYTLPSLDTILTRRRVTHLVWVLVPPLAPLPRRLARPLRPGLIPRGAPVLFSMLHSKLEGHKQTPTLVFGSVVLGWRAETSLYLDGPCMPMSIPHVMYPQVQSERDTLPSLDTILMRRRVIHLAWVLVAHLWPLPRWFAGPLRPGPMTSGAPVLFSMTHSELRGQKQTPTLSFCSKGLGWTAEKPLYHHGHCIALCVPQTRVSPFAKQDVPPLLPRRHTHSKAGFSPGLDTGGTTAASATEARTSSEARNNDQWGSSLVPHVTFRVGGTTGNIHCVLLLHGSGVESRNTTVSPWPESNCFFQ